MTECKNTVPGNKFLIICGLSFAGKSTLAKAIITQLGYEGVDVDETKELVYGTGIQDADLKPEDWVRIYTETDQLIERYLRSGKSVVDASRNFSRAEREVARSIADRFGVALLTVYIDTPEEMVRQRLLENRRKPSRRDVTDADFDDVIRAMQPPAAAENTLIFHYSDEIAAWIYENAKKLGSISIP